MRNLKRVLSLALALVMMLSLMVVNSSAVEATRIDFTDADEITYKEAVDVMVALGVIDGGDQGAFEPDGILTREQAAKVICYMLLGPENAENLTTNTQIFTDVAAGRWSAGYISYCANLDILAGTGEGTFLPAGELTGVTFGKMLLVALGYRADIEGYVGSNWATAIASDMVDAGIAVNGVVMTEPLTREQAAQMAFQTLEATMVKYSGEPVTVNTSDGTSVIVSAPTADPVPSTGLNYNGAAAGTQSASYLQFCEKYFDKLTKYEDFDDLGRPGGIWKLGTAEICFVVDNAVATFSEPFSRKDLYATLGSSVATNLVGSYTAGKYTVEYVLNGWTGATGIYNCSEIKYANKANIAAEAGYELLNGSTNILAEDRGETGAVLGANGLLVEAYLVDTTGNGDEDQLRIVMTQTFLAQATDDYDADKGELKINILSDIATGTFESKLSSDDVAGLSAFAEDDYVLLTAYTSNGTSYTVQSVAAPEIVTGEVSTYTSTGSKTVTLGGTKYSYSLGESSADASEFDYSVGDVEYSVVLDPYGFVMLAEGVSGSNNYIFVREFATEGALVVNGQLVADAFFTDGTRESIQVKKVYAVDGTTELDPDGHAYNSGIGWFSYSVKDGKYTLTKLNTSTTTGRYAASTPTAPGNGTTVLTNDSVSIGAQAATNSTMYIVLKNKTVTTYTGYKNAPDATAGSGETVFSYVYDKHDFVQYVFLDVSADGSVSGGATSDEIFVLDVPDTVTDSNGISYVYKAVVNGEVGTVTASTSGLVAGLWVDPSYDGDGDVESAVQIRSNSTQPGNYKVQAEALPGVNVTQSSGVVRVGTASYKLASGCEILVIDGTTVDSVNATRLATMYRTDKLVGVVYGVLNNDNDYTRLYVHVGAADPAAGTKAVYKSGAGAVSAVALGSPSNSVSIGGVTIAVTDESDIDDIKTALEADGTFNTAWTITKAGDKLTFEAKSAGAVGTSGPASSVVSSNMSLVTAGAEAVKATATTTIVAGSASNATIGGNSGLDLTSSDATGTDTSNKYTWSAVEEDGGDYTVTLTSTTAGAAGNGAVDGFTFANGADAVKAKYEIDDVSGVIAAATSASATLTINSQGYTVTVADLAGQLAQWADAYNADGGNTDWVASVSEDNSYILYTAVAAGYSHPAEPSGAVLVTEGTDAE